MYDLYSKCYIDKKGIVTIPVILYSYHQVSVFKFVKISDLFTHNTSAD